MYNFADLHCDTITALYERKKELIKNNLHIDINRLNKFNSPTQVFAIWLAKKYYKDAFNMTNKMIDFFENELEKNKEYIKKIVSYDDILKDNKINAMLSIEGGESIEDNLNNVEHFYKRGVRIMSLCWNYENNLCYGVATKSKNGLKPFGREVVKIMNNLNMVVDVSHLNESGFFDLYKMARKPFIATHSNAYSVCQHYRNLKDDQLKAIKECGGIVGINLYPGFLNNENNANIEDVFRHIDYMEKMLGIDKICLGSDFDGIENTPKNLEDISKYSDLIFKIQNIYGKDIAEKIVYKNFYNFIKKNI